MHVYALRPTDSFLFREPPRHLLAHHPTTALVVFAAMALTVLVWGVLYTLRTRSPLFVWCVIAGATVYPFFVEPLGDIVIATWYPKNLDLAATVFGRPMPWIVPCFYVAFIPTMSIAAYTLAKTSSPRRLLAFAAVVGVLECGFEMLLSHYDWIHYYANPATIFGVPIYCLVQNGGFLVLIAWFLAVALPRTHGWRWALVPVGLMGALGVLAVGGTWPAYLAIQVGASTAVIWVAALISTVLNAAIVVWFAYSPQLRRLREGAELTGTSSGTTRGRNAAGRPAAHADAGVA